MEKVYYKSVLKNTYFEMFANQKESFMFHEATNTNSKVYTPLYSV